MKAINISKTIFSIIMAILFGCLMTVIPASFFCIVGKFVYGILALLWIQWTIDTPSKDKENRNEQKN